MRNVDIDLTHGAEEHIPTLPRQEENSSTSEGEGAGSRGGGAEGGGAEGGKSGGAGGGDGGNITSPSKEKDRGLPKRRRSSIASQLVVRRSSSNFRSTGVFPGWGEGDYNWGKLIAIGPSAPSEELPIEAKHLPMRQNEENLIKSHWKIVRQAHDEADVFFAATRKAQEVRDIPRTSPSATIPTFGAATPTTLPHLSISFSC